MVKKKEVKTTKTSTKKAIAKKVGASKPEPSKTSKVTKKNISREYSLWSIVSGIIGLIFFPIFFGTAGIVLGVLSLRHKEEKRRAIIGLVISSIAILSWIMYLIIYFY